MKPSKVEQLFKEAQYTWNLSDYSLVFYKELSNGFSKQGALGYCDTINKVIALSKDYVLVNDEKTVKETLLHEVAHALSESGHDELWRDMCRLVGAIPQAVACYKEFIQPIKIFGTVRLSKFLSRYYETECTCPKCVWYMYPY